MGVAKVKGFLGWGAVMKKVPPLSGIFKSVGLKMKYFLQNKQQKRQKDDTVNSLNMYYASTTCQELGEMTNFAFQFIKEQDYTWSPSPYMQHTDYLDFLSIVLREANKKKNEQVVICNGFKKEHIGSSPRTFN